MRYEIIVKTFTMGERTYFTDVRADAQTLAILLTGHRDVEMIIIREKKTP